MNYSDLVSDVMPEVMGCPEPTIERAIRDSVIDFCERGMAYRVENDPVALPANVSEVDLEIPTRTRLVRVLKVRHGSKPLDPRTRDDLDADGDWTDIKGAPTHYTFVSETAIRVVPYPNQSTTDKLHIRFAVAPTRASVAFPDEIGEKYYEIICAGAKARLMRMPSQAWSNTNMAAAYTQIFEKGVNKAKLEANNDKIRAERQVRMRRI